MSDRGVQLFEPCGRLSRQHQCIRVRRVDIEDARGQATGFLKIRSALRSSRLPEQTGRIHSTAPVQEHQPAGNGDSQKKDDEPDEPFHIRSRCRREQATTQQRNASGSRESKKKFVCNLMTPRTMDWQKGRKSLRQHPARPRPTPRNSVRTDII